MRRIRLKWRRQVPSRLAVAKLTANLSARAKLQQRRATASLSARAKLQPRLAVASGPPCVTRDPTDLTYVVKAHLGRFVDNVSQNLINLAGKFVSAGDPPIALVYDAIMPFCLDVARKLGIKGAAFFTQPCAVSALYYHYYEGNLKIGDHLGTTSFSMPAMPVMEIGDLPSLIPDRDLYPVFLSLMVNQFSNFQKADWLLVNTFDKLEEEV
ncbi:hypothetical protein RHGRI_010490 [Rhododendron griersonianum]|uniref:Uncharacterized protein n=1 Tax=Rhododendron griersonianum TaxID=479676 RepID=A0AAV6KIP8_9ERIC|nr:hypothetical protein RHGRI_010490 [Rhododendron griersonianum]